MGVTSGTAASRSLLRLSWILVRACGRRRQLQELAVGRGRVVHALTRGVDQRPDELAARDSWASARCTARPGCAPRGTAWSSEQLEGVLLGRVACLVVVGAARPRRRRLRRRGLGRLRLRRLGGGRLAGLFERSRSWSRVANTVGDPRPLQPASPPRRTSWPSKACWASAIERLQPCAHRRSRPASFSTSGGQAPSGFWAGRSVSSALSRSS